MARIKICGLKRIEDVEYINALKPDFCGFILADGFKRSVDFDTAKALSKAVCSETIKVGVFVDDSLEKIQRFLDQDMIDIVQLHGNESPDFCKKINAPVIKVLKVNAFDMADLYANCVDYYLLDSGTGTGKVFDWSKIPSLKKPMLLAGGLGVDNVKDAINAVNPYAVDMSSSVETNGVKDYDKIKQAIDIVRSIK